MGQTRMFRHPAARLVQVWAPEKANLKGRLCIVRDRELIERKRQAIELAQPGDDPVRGFIRDDQDAPQIHFGVARPRR
jgi:hypothetical protein